MLINSKRYSLLLLLILLYTTASMTTRSTRLVDIGINLTHRSFQQDREELVQRAFESGVGVLVLTGTSIKGSQEAHKYCEEHQADTKVQLFSTAGVHPHDAKSCNDQTLDMLRRLAQEPQVIAIGECGLDYNRNFSPPDVQRKWFEHQLQLAAEMNLPVFLHERDAHKDFHNILEQYCDKLPAAVVHCFTGNREALEAYLSLPNCSIGITGWVCDDRRGKELRKLVSLIPDDRLMIETDAPFLFPRDLPAERRSGSKKSRRNKPEYLDHICETIAQCREQTVEHVAKITTANAIRAFQLPNSAAGVFTGK